MKKFTLTKKNIEKIIEDITGIKTEILKIDSLKFTYKSDSKILENPIQDFLELIIPKTNFKFIVLNNIIKVSYNETKREFMGKNTSSSSNA